MMDIEQLISFDYIIFIVHPDLYVWLPHLGLAITFCNTFEFHPP